MDSEQLLPSIIKSTTSQYSHHGSMNEDEKNTCDINVWSDVCTNNPDEIKLEPYTILGNNINYQDSQFEYDTMCVPEHYFDAASNINFINESDDEDITPRNITTLQPNNKFNGTINLTEESSDDDVTIVTSSPNTSIRENEKVVNSDSLLHSHLVSIRSDHNYSSHEIDIGSSDESLLNTSTDEIHCMDEATKSESVIEPVAAEPANAESGVVESGDAESGDAESGDAEPGDAEPGDAEPGNAESGDTEPGDAESCDAELVDVKPSDTELVDAKPGDTELVDAEPVDADSVNTEPVKTEPVNTESVDDEPTDTELVSGKLVKPVDSEPIDSEPINSEPVASEPIDPESVDSEPVASEPITSEPIDSEPVNSEPADVSSIDVQPASAELIDVQPVVVERMNAESADEQPSQCEINIKSLINKLIETDRSKNDQINILSDLENEVKLMKALLRDTDQDREVDSQSDSVPKASINEIDSENDTNYIMSEGHSEPLEYRKITVDEILNNNSVGGSNVTLEKDSELAMDIETSDQNVPNEDQTTCEVENENNLESSGKCVVTQDVVSEKSIIQQKIESVRSVVERVSLKLSSFSQLIAGNEVTDDSLKKHSTDLATTTHELMKSVKAVTQVVDAEIHKKLNDKSKKRWLADSSDEASGSEDSYVSSVARRKKRRSRKRISPIDSDSHSEEVLEKVDWKTSAELKSNGLAEEIAVELSDTEEKKSDCKSTLEKGDLQASPAGFTDIDMTKYLLPPAKTDSDDLLDGSDIEMEEFLGFDVLNGVAEIDVNDEENENDDDQDKDHMLDVEPRIVPAIVSQEWDLIDNTNQDAETNDDKQHVIQNENNAEDDIHANVEKEADDDKDSEKKQTDDYIKPDENEAEADASNAKNTQDENEADSSEVADDDKEEEEEEAYDSDKEIDRLVDLSTILTKNRPASEYVYKKTISKKKSKTDDILDIINDNNLEIDSESSEEEEMISEEQFLLLEAKKKCFKDSSDEESNEASENEDDDSLSSIDDPSDESNDSKLDKFLKKRLVNEINDQFINDDRTDKCENTAEKSINESVQEFEPTEEAMEQVVNTGPVPEPKSNNGPRIETLLEPDIQLEPVVESEPVVELESVVESEPVPQSDPPTQPKPVAQLEPTTQTKPVAQMEVHGEPQSDFVQSNAEPEDDTEPEEEEEEEEVLRSSGIFEPEIELRDGDKLSDESTKKEEKKRYKLDTIAFNKNLFHNLEDLDEKSDDTHVINSDNSDCEMLDISMFKTKNTTADLDKIIQNQKKRDATKTSKVADECISLSSDSDLEMEKTIIGSDSEDEKPTKSRPMLRNDQLAGETKQAQKEETDRLKRLDKKNDRMTQLVESQSEKLTQTVDDSNVILDYDSKRQSAISVHPEIVKNLKEHQIDGVKFMYDCCYGSVDSIDKHQGSGCILAHCMGLGKTLQLIALLHTLIRYPQLKTKKILVICPKSTIMNWADEIQLWLRSVKVKLKVLHFPDPSDIHKKLQILREWHKFKADPEGRAGCMLIGYEAFRSLVFYYKKAKTDVPQVEIDRIKKQVDEYLLNPGADLVVCDEGHVIKNRKSTTSLAVNQIHSRRRIILTGTPIQNNLKEYYSMVNFIKPSFLGTEKEFANLYENPIKEGQHKDSDKSQIRIMKQRSYVLHKKLSKFVQRREAALLKTFLPEKYEYVLFIPMTELQNRLYQYFLDNNPLKEKFGGKSLIPDYTFLRKIWTHPKVLENAWKNAMDKKIALKKRNMESDEEPDDVLDNQTGKMSVQNDWWRQFIEPSDLRSLLPSNKLRILFEILRLCQQTGEKCLIFSAFVAVLDVVEFFMQQIHNKHFNSGSDLGLENFHGPWEPNHDYYRLDGKTSKILRHVMIQKFNDPANKRVKCFLISAKAGGQGINLTGANRVILLDTSWNPSNDQQNIFRVFRLGQQRKCYIYRLLAMGTMEEKVYSRSVTKQAMSFRVVDEQQIDRHYSLAELAELYTLTIPDPATQPTPIRPADNILASLLRNCKHLVYKYHEHDSLLENNSAEDLNEQEKADAWAAYENDVSMKNQFGNLSMSSDGLYNNPYSSLNMGLNMMNPYNFIPQNLPSHLISPYLHRMGYPEPELLMMSQMYSLNSSGPTSSYGALGSMYNPPGASINSLYNSPSSSTSNYYKPNISPTTTSSPSAYTSNMTTPMSSSTFNGLNPLSTSSSVTSQNMMYNLARLMPTYAGLTGTSNPVPSSSRPSSSSIASAYPSPFNLYGSSTNTNIGSSPQPSVQPGPNAIKNPLLSNLLPVPSNTKDPFSIPTSVITKASKDLQRAVTHPQENRSISSTNPINPLSLSRPSSAHSSHSISPSFSVTKTTTTARASPLTTTSNSASLAVNSSSTTSPSAARNSPSTARSSPSAGKNITSTPRINTMLHPQQQQQHNPTRQILPPPRQTSQQPQRQTSQQQQQQQKQQQQQQQKQQQQQQQKQQQQQPLKSPQAPLSITLSGSRNSPESNIIVKDVNTINRTVERREPPISKTSAQPIKNFNMGIVYPKALDQNSFEISQDHKLLRTAQDQLNSLRSNIAPAQNVAQNSSPKSGITQLQQKSNRTPNRPAIATVNRTNDIRNISRVADKTMTSSIAPPPKSNLASALPTNEVTITPTRRLQKATTATTTIGQKTSINRKPPLEVNKISNLPISTLSSVSRLPASTSITRQTTMPIVGNNMNSVAGRISNQPNSMNSKTTKPMPTLSRQVSLPTLKVISQPGSSVFNQTNTAKTSAVVRRIEPTLNTNQNGVPKSPASMQRSANTSIGGVRKVISVGSSSMPKLVNLATTSPSNEARKRKLEEMIPMNSGLTLTVKKSRTDTSVQKSDSKPGVTRNSSFVGLPVIPRNPRPRDTQPPTMEVVELD